MIVNNHDVVGVVKRLDRYCLELHKSVSSAGSELNPFDTERLQSYLDSLVSYIAWVTGQPQLDLPESSPKDHTVADPMAFPDVENEGTNDCLRLLGLCRTELTNSQSARDAAGLKAHDKKRILSVVAKVQALLTDHISAQDALDLPESSPQAASSGSGRTGI